MSWTSTVVTREKLYEEVWAEPVVKVAKRYGVSDVALRKVCVKLSVPVPPQGYWAKRAHGRPTTRPGLPLKANIQQHVFRRWVTPIDEELQARLAEVQVDATSVQGEPTQTGIAVETDHTKWHRVVKRTANATRSEFPRLPESWRIAKGPRQFWIHTSKGSEDRALSILDLLVRLCVANGIDIAQEGDENLPARVVVRGYTFTFRIVERATKGERQLTAAERDALSRDEGAFVANRITKQGTGHLRLEVLNKTDYPSLSRSDTRNQRLEEVIYDLPAALQRYAIEQSVRDALAKERAERAEAERQRRQALIDFKGEQLSRLEKTEKEAEQWRRARHLQRYARAMYTEANSDETPAEQRELLLAQAQWTERAAAWLNPLVRQHWPEVDDAPESLYDWVHLER